VIEASTPGGATRSCSSAARPPTRSSTMTASGRTPGRTQAGDPCGPTVWQLRRPLRQPCPIMATATDLLFQGAPGRLMRAIDATNGEIV
jgi:hypothetical protein